MTEKKDEQVKAEMIPVGCGSKKSQGCCSVSKECRLEVQYNPNTGSQIYTGRCCQSY